MKEEHAPLQLPGTVSYRKWLANKGGAPKFDIIRAQLQRSNYKKLAPIALQKLAGNQGKGGLLGAGELSHCCCLLYSVLHTT